MDKVLKQTTIKSLIDNIVINNKFLKIEDIEALKKKFISSDKKLKDIENQINYEVSKLEKKYNKSLKQEKAKSKAEIKDNKKSVDEDIVEYTMYTYQKEGVSSSKKVKIEKMHLGDDDYTKPVHVTVNDSIKGYLKLNSSNLVDSVDLALSVMGKYLGVNVTGIYKVEDNKKNTGILSIDIFNDKIKDNKTIGAIINKNYAKSLTNDYYSGWVKELISLPESDKDHVIEDEMSLKTLIDLGYNIVFEEYDMTEEEKSKFKKDYLNMIIFDFITNQMDRNSENVGIIVDKKDKVSLAPLYDNGCVIDEEHLNKNSTRFLMKIVNREKLIKVLIKYYMDEVKDFVYKFINNKEVNNNIMNIINTYLTEKDSVWYSGIVDLNIKNLKNIVKDVIDSTSTVNNSSAGYATILQQSMIVVICCIILGFIIGAIFAIYS